MRPRKTVQSLFGTRQHLMDLVCVTSQCICCSGVHLTRLMNFTICLRSGVAVGVYKAPCLGCVDYGAVDASALSPQLNGLLLLFMRRFPSLDPAPHVYQMHTSCTLLHPLQLLPACSWTWQSVLQIARSCCKPAGALRYVRLRPCHDASARLHRACRFAVQVQKTSTGLTQAPLPPAAAVTRIGVRHKGVRFRTYRCTAS